MHFESPSFRPLVISCDAYADLWPYFFHFLFHYWPDVPTPIYLISNHDRYDDPRVVTIRTGEDTSWSETLARGLEAVTEPYVLTFLDDFFLKRTPDLEDISTVFEELVRHDGNWVNLKPMGLPVDGYPHIAPLTDPRQSGGFHSGIWRTCYLRDIAAAGPRNIWHMEGYLREIIREGQGHNLFYLTRNHHWLIGYQESIKGGFWKKDGLAFVREHGLEPDLSYRPCPNPGGGLPGRLWRSYLKRRMRRHLARACASPRLITPRVL